MRTFAAKQQPTHEAESASSETASRAFPRQGRQTSLIPNSHRSIGNHAAPQLLPAYKHESKDWSRAGALPNLGHDFSQIPVYADEHRTIQPKLQFGIQGDIYEQQADQIAEQVMRMPEAHLQRTCACGGGCSSCQNEQTANEHLQTKRVQSGDLSQISAPLITRNTMMPGIRPLTVVQGKVNSEAARISQVPPVIHQVLGSPGRPLSQADQTFMESRFKHDFSRVRIHAGTQAAESARAVNALAYKVGGCLPMNWFM